MRKNLSRALAAASGLTLVVGLAACGPDTTTSASPSESTTTSAAPTESATTSASPSETATATATATAVGEATTGPVQAPAEAGEVPSEAPTTTGNAPYFVLTYGSQAGFRQDADYSGPGDSSPDVGIVVDQVEGQPAGTFSITIYNETDAAFDMTQAQVQALDASGAVVAQITDVGTNYFPTPIPAGEQLEQEWYFAVDPSAVTITVKPTPQQYTSGWATTAVSR